jgi:hypothetical protein
MSKRPIQRHVRALLSAVDRAAVALSEAVRARDAILREAEDAGGKTAVKKAEKQKK